ncbi:MAG: DNA repair protein RecN [Ruminococcaceae bacterium]|nr:DNA repair protein RecN [Oscillospiraceae bacterium]
MLINLDIKNIALIEQISLEAEKGMTVLTGETGAGKSIIIDAVNLLIGSRTNKGLVRYGTDKARVSGIFTSNKEVENILFELGIDTEDDIIISRDITSDGKSVCRINGAVTPQSTLKTVGEHLINIHGQQDNQALLNPSKHIDFLDSYAKTDLTNYQQVYSLLLTKRKELAELSKNEDDRVFKIDSLLYQLSEIGEAHLIPGEKTELSAEKNILVNAEKITLAINDARQCLYEESSAYDQLSASISSLESIAGYDTSIDSILEKLRDALYAVEDGVHELRRIADKIEYDENRLNEIEERLDLISKLEKKYGGSIEAVLEYEKNAAQTLEQLENADENIEALKKEIQNLEKELQKESEKITDYRKKYALILQNEIESSLKELDMPNVKFAVSITSSEYTAQGADTVEFMICPNAGELLKPLAEIASGGELSRVMLAIKSILADGADTLIFDEIDTGVSGNAALKIAKKLKKLSEKKQVICISHQPQLASVADNHIKIKKVQKENRTVTNLSVLSHDERIKEIARIIDGDEYTETAIAHAKEMLGMQ